MIYVLGVLLMSGPWSSIHEITASGKVALILDNGKFWESVKEIAALISTEVADVVDSPIPKRIKYDSSTPWRERTIVPQELSTQEAIKFSKSLLSPPQGGTLSNTLVAVIRSIAGMGDTIVPWRVTQRERFKSISRRLEGLNPRLRALIPAHGRSLNARMNFATLYALHAAIRYMDRLLIDKMLFGFEVIYNIPTSLVFREITEPPVVPFTTSENLACFDMVSKRLHKAARDAMRVGADPQAAKTLEIVWEGIVGEQGEVKKGLMDGGLDGRGYSRQQIWSHFRHVQGGPRCLNRFGV